MAFKRQRTVRSYPSPITNFDDSNRESYIARSNQGITSLPSSIIPFRTSETPRENFIARTQGGNKDRDFNTSDSLYNLFRKYKEDPAQEGILDKLRDKAEDFFDPDPGLEVTVPVGDLVRPAGLFGPGPFLGDPTGEGGIIQRLGEFLGLTDPIDPENEGLPMDEYQEYRERGLKPMMDEIAMDDTYTLPNLLQMLDDARDAGNEEEMERYMNDLELLYPGATMSGIV